MHSFKDLIQFREDLEQFVNETEKHPLRGDRDFFRCVAGPWLSRQLIPRPEQDNSCRFARCFQNAEKDVFVKEIVGPLLGNDPFRRRGQVAATDSSLIGRIHQFAPNLLRGLELRLATIHAVFQGVKTDHIRSLLTAYQEFFGSTNTVWEEPPACQQQRGKHTAAFCMLQKEYSEHATRIEQVIDRGNESYLDPAVAFLIDTIVECSGKSLNDRPFQSEHSDAAHQWHPGQTWVMTVVTRGTEQLGIVAKLLVEAVAFSQSAAQVPEDAPGAFYPHPHLGVHFRINYDFQEAIRNAWLATIGCALARDEAIQHDYRWSLIPYDPDDVNPVPYKDLEDQIQLRIQLYDVDKNEGKKWEEIRDETSRHLYLWYPLSGPSATLPFALVIRSSRRNETIRRDVAATADFKILKGIDGINEHQLLKEVGALPHKLEAAKQVQVEHLIVCTNQKSSLPLKDDVWLRATELSVAYREATEIEKELARYAEYVAGRWNRIVEAGKTKPAETSD